jgi:beta-galactosidase
VVRVRLPVRLRQPAPGREALIGDNPFDFAAAGGAGAVWVRSLPGAPGTVTVTARHPGVGSAAARVRVRGPA